MTVNHSFKGLWIPREIMMDSNLSINEKVLLAVILNLTKNKDQSCKASNAYLSQMMKLSLRRVQQLLMSLKEKNYINARNIFHEGTKNVSHRLMKISSQGSRSGLHIDNKEDRKVYIEKNPELNEIFYDFIEYREELKKPLCESSLKAVAQNLLALSNSLPEKARKIVDQTIQNGWSNLWELKNDNLKHRRLPEGKILKKGVFNDYSNLGF